MLIVFPIYSFVSVFLTTWLPTRCLIGFASSPVWPLIYRQRWLVGSLAFLSLGLRKDRNQRVFRIAAALEFIFDRGLDCLWSASFLQVNLAAPIWGPEPRFELPAGPQSSLGSPSNAQTLRTQHWTNCRLSFLKDWVAIIAREFSIDFDPDSHQAPAGIALCSLHFYARPIVSYLSATWAGEVAEALEAWIDFHSRGQAFWRVACSISPCLFRHRSGVDFELQISQPDLIALLIQLLSSDCHWFQAY